MLLKTDPRNSNRFFVVGGAPVLFGELRKSNRRRIPLDPASKFFNPRIFRHGTYGTATAFVTKLTRPRLSVSLSLTL